MRRAGRQLGWKIQTYSYPHSGHVWVCVNDQREVPQSAAALVQAARNLLMSNALEAVWARSEGREPVPREPSAAERERAGRFSLEVETLLTSILGDPHIPASGS
jgi:hypothetical protein